MANIVIDDLTLTIDPNNYSLIGGKRRGSVHRLLNGGTVVQDMGFSANDMEIQMSGVAHNHSTLRRLMELYEAGGPYTMTDFYGNEFSVRFVPGLESFNAQMVRGSGNAFNYNLLLIVVNCTKWLGVDSSFPS